MVTDYSKLKRKRHAMPGYIKEALEKKGLMNDYLARPAYQQNDYIGWIEQAKKQETRDKRLSQMLEELNPMILKVGLPQIQQSLSLG